MAELIFPSWRVHISIEKKSYDRYKGFFDYLDIDIEVLPEDKFCKMMLWRLRPAWTGKYDRVLSRDVDSLLHYRERQAVDNWIPNGRCVHSIADSQSHTIPLMGGMIGVESVKFVNLIGTPTWEDFVTDGWGIDFTKKGTDQQFMQERILPIVANKMVEHYVDGMDHSMADYKHRGAFYRFIQDDDVEDIPVEMRESTYLVSHIGQAGFAIEPVLLFIDKYMSPERKEWYEVIEKEFPQIHYWINDV